MKVESPRELCRSMSALFSRKLSSLRDTRPSGRSESREWNRRIGVASSSRFGRVGARVLGKTRLGAGHSARGRARALTCASPRCRARRRSSRGSRCVQPSCASARTPRSPGRPWTQSPLRPRPAQPAADPRPRRAQTSGRPTPARPRCRARPPRWGGRCAGSRRRYRRVCGRCSCRRAAGASRRERRRRARAGTPRPGRWRSSSRGRCRASHEWGPANPTGSVHDSDAPMSRSGTPTRCVSSRRPRELTASTRAGCEVLCVGPRDSVPPPAVARNAWERPALKILVLHRGCVSRVRD